MKRRLTFEQYNELSEEEKKKFCPVYLDEEYDTFSSDHDFIMKCKENGLGILSIKLPLVHLFCHTTKRIKGEEEKMKLARERFKQKWNRD